MILRETIQSLSEEELQMLLVIVNIIFPCGVIIDQNTISSYKFKHLAIHVSNAKSKIKEEYLEIYGRLCDKLKIPN